MTVKKSHELQKRLHATIGHRHGWFDLSQHECDSKCGDNLTRKQDCDKNLFLDISNKVQTFEPNCKSMHQM